MTGLLAHLGLAAGVFASTNVDGFLLLAALFADPDLGRRNVVAGWLLGASTLIAAAVVAAMAWRDAPLGWTQVLGLVPLGLGLRALIVQTRHAPAFPGGGPPPAPFANGRLGTRNQALAVAGLTVAGGGDNLGAYIPLFASAPQQIVLYVAAFAALSGLWCLIALKLTGNRWVRSRVGGFGRALLPFVLIGLGLYILTRPI